MKREIILTVPEQFYLTCEFMGYRPASFLEAFIDNILPLDNNPEPDTMERILAIKYFLTYSANRNHVYDMHVRLRRAHINKTVSRIDRFLPHLKGQENQADGSFQEFLTDWLTKWKSVVDLMMDDTPEHAHPDIDQPSMQQEARKAKEQ